MFDILIIGALPPPIGGVTTHIQRFFEHSLRDPRVNVGVLDIKKRCLTNKYGVSCKLKDMLKSIFSCRVVHIQVSSQVKIFIALFFRLMGKGVVYTHHNRVVGNVFIFKIMCFLCQKVVLVSGDLDRPIQSKRFVVIPAFLPPAETSPLRGDVERFISRFSKVVAFNAYSLNYIDDDEVYGVDLVVKACEIITRKKAISDLCFVFFDPSDAYSHYDFRGLIGSMIGRFSGHDLSYYDLLVKSDLSLRPTRTDGDALSVRESLFAGVPVVASDCTVRPESSIIFKSGDAEALAAAIMENLSQPRAMIEKPVGVNFYEALVDLYSGIIEKRRITK